MADKACEWLDKQFVQKDSEEESNQLKQSIQKFDVFQIVNETHPIPFYQDRISYKTAFQEFFKIIFKDDVFDKITTSEDFEIYRDLIRAMHKIHYDKPNANPELAYYDKLTQIMREKKGEVVTVKSMITSVGLYRLDVLDMTIYSLHEYFDRIGYFKNHDTTNLFKTVSTEKLDAIPWYKDNNVKQTKLDENDLKYINRQSSVVKDDINK